MSLVSKKTFRKWAQALTDRGLTVNDAEVVAEIGNAAYIKGQKQLIPASSSVQIGLNAVSFMVGAVWINGTAHEFFDGPPGTRVAVPFDRIEDDVTVYVYVPFIAVLNYRPSIPVDSGEDEIPNWQVIRVDLNGSIGVESIATRLVTPEYEITPSIVGDGSASAGWLRKPLFQMVKSPEDDKIYNVSVINAPEELIVCNIASLVVDNQIPLTFTAALV